MVLAFSGGGTRAAALAYGVLEAMRDTTVNLDGQPKRLLDEIDVISSVSGGSFTAAYFGLHGDRIFTDFENSFLRADVTGELVSGLFQPALWFSEGGRTEMAIDYYDEKVFRGATFADLQRGEAGLRLYLQPGCACLSETSWPARTGREDGGNGATAYWQALRRAVLPDNGRRCVFA